jgi:hypothetical protein
MLNPWPMPSAQRIDLIPLTAYFCFPRPRNLSRRSTFDDSVESIGEEGGSISRMRTMIFSALCAPTTASTQWSITPQLPRPYSSQLLGLLGLASEARSTGIFYSQNAAIHLGLLPLCVFAPLREISLGSSLSIFPLSDYGFRQWDYASEDVLESGSNIRPRGVPVADAADVSWRRS